MFIVLRPGWVTSRAGADEDFPRLPGPAQQMSSHANEQFAAH
jgi:hypothetical protein